MESGRPNRKRLGNPHQSRVNNELPLFKLRHRLDVTPLIPHAGICEGGVGQPMSLCAIRVVAGNGANLRLLWDGFRGRERNVLLKEGLHTFGFNVLGEVCRTSLGGFLG